MTTAILPLLERPAWAALQSHHSLLAEAHLRELFAADPGRAARFTVEALGIYLDYSKNRITEDTVRLLLELAEQSGLRARIDAMFRGDAINVSEHRSVLHVALRAPRGASIMVKGENVVPQVHDVLDRMSRFSEQVRAGQWLGHGGKRSAIS